MTNTDFFVLFQMGRFNVAKAMQGGGGGIVNPAMDMGSMPTGTVAN